LIAAGRAENNAFRYEAFYAQILRSFDAIIYTDKSTILNEDE
jgi:hypothetical protein